MRTTLQNPKRLIAVIASLMLILIVACGSSAAPAGDTTTTPPAQPAQPAQQVQPAQPAQQQQPGSDTPAQEAPGSSAAQEPAMSQTAPTAAPQANEAPMAAEARLAKLGVAVGAQSYDTNYSYKVIISGYLDKRPVLEWLVGVDRFTGQYEPQLAESWEMAPNGKDWTFKLREGVEFHDGWGEFTAQDVRHSAWLLVSPTSTASGISTWRQYQGVNKDDEPETVMERSAEFIEIVDDQTVIIHNQSVFPEALYQFGYRRNWPMESKARWDGVGGDEGYGAKIVGTGPLKFVERIEGSHVSYEAVENIGG